MVSEPVFWNPNPFWPPLIQAIIHSGQISLAISHSDHLSLWPSLIPVISPYSQSQGRKRFPVGRIVVRKPSTRRPRALFPAGAGAWGRMSHFLATRFFLQARLTPTSHPSYLFLPSEPCTCLFWGSFASVGTSISFSGVLRLFFLNSNPCTCLGKCSSTFPVHDKIRNGIITSIQRHVTRISGQIWNSKPWWQWFLSYSHHRTQIKWP